jgi:hypothetical protein
VVKVYQLTISASYRVFSNGVPGALMAFGPGQQRGPWWYYIPWALGGAAIGILVVLAANYLRHRRARSARAGARALCSPPSAISVNRGQALGGVLGLAILACIFVLPFSNIAEGPAGPTDTLYAIFYLFVTTFANVQAIGLAAIINLSYVYIVATILLFIAGIVGVYSLVSAILELVGMGMATIGPFFIFTSYTFGSTTFGIGFWMLWAIGVLLLFAAYWGRRAGARPAALASPASTPSGPTP